MDDDSLLPLCLTHNTIIQIIILSRYRVRFYSSLGVTNNIVSQSLQNKFYLHLPALIILLGFIILAVIYSLINPIFEAGDESRHYAVVKYMADTGQLPIQDKVIVGEALHHWEHEGNQPPLYYAISALLTSWIDTGSWEDVYWYNPHTSIGDPLRLDNKNIVIHPLHEPWQGHVLAVHLLRFFSISLATLTVAVSYLIALTLSQGNRWFAIGAMAITAFNPMFIFISSAVNNDNAVILFVTLALWVMVSMIEQMGKWTNQYLKKSINQRPNDSKKEPWWGGWLFVRWLLLLGLLIGLGALSKLYAIGLLPLAGLLFIWLAYQRTNTFNQMIQAILLWSIIVGSLVLVIAGWFYLRNALIYEGDFLALQSMRDAAGTRDRDLTLATLWAEFEGLRIAYWALFGGVNVLVAPWIYTILDTVSFMALLGLVMFTVHTVYNRYIISSYENPVALDENKIDSFTNSKIALDPNLQKGDGLEKKQPEKDKVVVTSLAEVVTLQIHQPVLVLLLGWCLIMLAGFIVWNLTQPATQGRLFYPAIAAISALMMIGLSYGWFWLVDFSLRKIIKPTHKVLLRTVQIPLTSTIVLSMFLFAVIVPFVYIPNAYAKTQIFTETDIPSEIIPLNLTYDETIRLIGYQQHTPQVRAGESVRLTLYWQLLQSTETNYSIFVHLLGRNREKVAQRDSYPGGGSWPTTILQPGDVLADEYYIPISYTAETDQAPTQLLIAAGIYDYNEVDRPGRAAFNNLGEQVEPIIGRLKLALWNQPDVESSPDSVKFLDYVTLLNHQLSPSQQTLTLTWQVEQPLTVDYTVFIQAWDQQTNQQLNGFDGPPLQGNYPTTLWERDEIIIDAHSINLNTMSNNSYLLVGLYNPQTQERLPAFQYDEPLPNYAVQIELESP